MLQLLAGLSRQQLLEDVDVVDLVRVGQVGRLEALNRARIDHAQQAGLLHVLEREQFLIMEDPGVRADAVQQQRHLDD